jgi:hypothetical protein
MLATMYIDKDKRLFTQNFNLNGAIYRLIKNRINHILNKSFAVIYGQMKARRVVPHLNPINKSNSKWSSTRFKSAPDKEQREFPFITPSGF